MVVRLLPASGMIRRGRSGLFCSGEPQCCNLMTARNAAWRLAIFSQSRRTSAIESNLFQTMPSGWRYTLGRAEHGFNLGNRLQERACRASKKRGWIESKQFFGWHSRQIEGLNAGLL